MCSFFCIFYAAKLDTHSALTNKIPYLIVLTRHSKSLIINMRNNFQFLIISISGLRLHFRHEKFLVRGAGVQDALFEPASAVVEVLYLDIREYAYRPWREAGIEVGEK